MKERRAFIIENINTKITKGNALKHNHIRATYAVGVVAGVGTRLDCTLVADQPFAPLVAEYVTASPSRKVRKPASCSMVEKCTKISSPCGPTTNPKPLRGSNHFTVPWTFTNSVSLLIERISRNSKSPIDAICIIVCSICHLCKGNFKNICK